MKPILTIQSRSLRAAPALFATLCCLPLFAGCSEGEAAGPRSAAIAPTPPEEGSPPAAAEARNGPREAVPLAAPTPPEAEAAPAPEAAASVPAPAPIPPPAPAMPPAATERPSWVDDPASFYDPPQPSVVLVVGKSMSGRGPERIRRISAETKGRSQLMAARGKGQSDATVARDADSSLVVMDLKGELDNIVTLAKWIAPDGTYYVLMK